MTRPEPLIRILTSAHRYADGRVFCPRQISGPARTIESIKRRLKRAGWAESCGDGFWRITDSGIAALAEQRGENP